MKVVILAGGLGTRLSEETVDRPKPMVGVGGKPIIWHIMKIYSSYGINDFIICCGYKGYLIKEYFSNYFLHSSDVTLDLRSNTMEVHEKYVEPWRVTLVDTGQDTMTGGRLKRVRKFVEDQTFCFTYGDGVSDVNVAEQLAFHESHGRKCTVTAVQPPGRWGGLVLNQDRVVEFREKPKGDGAWINGGFFVLEPEAIDLVDGDETVWEREPMEALAGTGDLAAFRHLGFWQAMDTVRDRYKLEEEWDSGRAPWKNW